MLRRQSGGGGGDGGASAASPSVQFIFTAHKREMVERAVSLFRVKMINNQSRIFTSTLQEAAKYFAKRPATTPTTPAGARRVDDEDSETSERGSTSVGSTASYERLAAAMDAAAAAAAAENEDAAVEDEDTAMEVGATPLRLSSSESPVDSWASSSSLLRA